MELTQDETIKTYQALIKELLRIKPDEKKIRSLMKNLGMKYSTENVDRMATALAFNPTRGKKVDHDL